MRTARLALVRGAVSLRAASSIVDDLKDNILARHKLDTVKINDLKKNYGHEKLSDATVDAAYGGMRGICGLVYEGSLLDPIEGIRYRGMSIPECQAVLPKAEGGKEPLPEGVFWLLLTGEVPTEKQVRELSKELHARADARAVEATQKVLNAMPANTHPMTAFSAGVLTLQTYSKFAKAYAEGKSTKSDYWEYALEDALDLLARSPALAAMVYNHKMKGRAELTIQANPELDWAANFTNMLGFNNKEFWECMRLYLSIHADHEGGNVSAHTTTLVASALSDPYLAVSAGLNGLAGPLHGLANQEALVFLQRMQAKLKTDGVNLADDKALAEAISKYSWSTLNSGHVIPGFGHAVLRRTDPRYMCLREFCLRHFPNDELFRLVSTMYTILPDLLTKHGKTKNPFPNVDAHSGVVLQHYGLTEQSYYTVLFGLSRQMGVLTAVILDRLQGRPLERPKSTTTAALAKRYLTKSL